MDTVTNSVNSFNFPDFRNRVATSKSVPANSNNFEPVGETDKKVNKHLFLAVFGPILGIAQCKDLLFDGINKLKDYPKQLRALNTNNGEFFLDPIRSAHMGSIIDHETQNNLIIDAEGDDNSFSRLASDWLKEFKKNNKFEVFKMRIGVPLKTAVMTISSALGFYGLYKVFKDGVHINQDKA